MKWTAEQLSAIRTTGTNLLVSAAAGSGKTAVLAERCAYLVCDAPEPCDLDQLLVVTFTKAATDEMRGRIEQALRGRPNAEDDPRLTRQLLLLARAQINTLHGFCTQVLRRHFHVLGLDPNFRVLDDEEIKLLKHDIARDVLDDRYDAGDPDFRQLVDDYADGYDPRIHSHILDMHRLMESVVDPDAWLNSAADRINQARLARPLASNDMGRELMLLIQRWLSELRDQAVSLARQIAPVRGLESYAEYVNDLLAAVEHWRMELAEDNLDALANAVKAFEPRRLPTISRPPPEKEAIQAQINQLRKEMTGSTMAAACRFSEREWRDALSLTLPATRVLISLVTEFSRRFTQAKRDLRGVDFADLERFTLNVLRESAASQEPSAVARVYQKQFRHLLVDEYQDINPVQDAILTLLSRGDNLFSVGDVKQSIYRFRLAQPRRFLEKLSSFRKNSSIGRVIDLASNFRSRAPLLEVINGVFTRLMSESAVEIEYDASHELRPGAQYPPAAAAAFTGAPIELHLLPIPPRGAEETDDPDLDLDRIEREAVFVAHRVRELMSQGMQVAAKSADGSLEMRPLRYRDIVVLLRSMRYKGQQMAHAMRAGGVPVHSDSATGFFESTEVRDMLSLLRVLDNQRQDIPLAAFLRSPIAGLDRPEDALATIRLAYPRIPFHEAAVTYANEKEDGLAGKLKELFARLKDWRRMAHQRPVAELVWQIYDETGYLAFSGGMVDGAQRAANLLEFHERSRQFGTFQRQGLGRFMQFLQSLADQEDLGQPSIASEADDVVRIMTIHHAKGLEFPVVFVPDLGKLHNLLDARGPVLVDREAGIGLMAVDQAKRVRYPTLSHLLVQDRIKRQSLAEEMRVLYVAMTRAREHLILVGTCDPARPDEWKEEWSAHQGAMPSHRILGGRTMLDWVGPAASMLANAKDQPIQVTMHEEGELATWSQADNSQTKPEADRSPYADQAPLSPAPSPNADANDLIERMTRVYAHLPFAAIGAATSVGALTKEGTPVPNSWESGRGPALSFGPDLTPPKFVAAEGTPRATEIGTATHIVLQHLDFSRRCDREDISLQISDLARRKLLPEEFLKVVDAEAILWLLSTPLGETLRRNNDQLQRELPVYFPMPAPGAPDSGDPMDRVMVRGRLDVLVPDESGPIIVDYKTDSVTEQAVDARTQFYKPQVIAYRDAIGNALGRPVSRAMLVFLAPRLIREV